MFPTGFSPEATLRVLACDEAVSLRVLECELEVRLRVLKCDEEVSPRVLECDEDVSGRWVGAGVHCWVGFSDEQEAALRTAVR